MKKLTRLIDFVFVTLLLPLLLSLVVYYGFFTNYTGGLFSETGFHRQYFDGIYKYRLLGRELLLGLHSLIADKTLFAWIFSRFEPRALYLFDSEGTTIFYGSYFLLNTFFLCLATMMLYVLFARHLDEKLKPHRNLLILTAVLLMTITQYVVVPYDTLSYFFLILAILLILQKGWASYILLLVVVTLATLTRETAVFILAFYVAVYYMPLLAKNRLHWQKLAGLLIAFGTTYFLLRLLINGNNAIFQKILLFRNVTNPSAIGGILLFAVISYALINHSHNFHNSLLFLFLSAPYILMVIFVANPWEIRLWTPVWLVLLISGVIFIPDLSQHRQGNIDP